MIIEKLAIIEATNYAIQNILCQEQPFSCIALKAGLRRNSLVRIPESTVCKIKALYDKKANTCSPAPGFFDIPESIDRAVWKDWILDRAVKLVQFQNFIRYTKNETVLELFKKENTE